MGLIEIDRHDWASFPAFRDPARVPGLLRVVLSSEREEEWAPALANLETCGSDLGVPCAMTPALVSCLVAIALRTDGKKGAAVVSLLEELTCGRGAEGYSEQERHWLHEAVRALMPGLSLWEAIVENGSRDDAVNAIDLLAYCAEHFPEQRDRVRRVLGSCEQQRPELAEEIRAVWPYWECP